ncbi:Unsaturated rhamnogalacturonyl hydrolase YesR [compost metagenome]
MDYPEFYREVSGSAGIAYGMMRSIEMSLLPSSEKATASIERVLIAVLPYIKEDGVVEGVSGGTPVMPSIQAYQD